jgi:hypothetical protein
VDDLRCEQFFRQPQQLQQRRYEALRAFFLERRPLPDIARQFGLAHGTLRNLALRKSAFKLDDRKAIRWYRNAANRGPITLPLIWEWSSLEAFVVHLEKRVGEFGGSTRIDLQWGTWFEFSRRAIVRSVRRVTIN